MDLKVMVMEPVIFPILKANYGFKETINRDRCISRSNSCPSFHPNSFTVFSGKIMTYLWWVLSLYL